MHKLIHYVILEVFQKEDPLSLNHLAPVPVEKLKEEQFRWHPEKNHTKVYELPKRGITLMESETPTDHGSLTVQTYKFEKNYDVKEFGEKLAKMPKEDRHRILNNLDEYLDESGRLLLRLSVEEPLMLATRPCIFARINLAAYPKNEETTAKVAQEILA